MLDGCSLGGDSTAFMDRRVAISSMNLLINRLSHVPTIEFLPLVEGAVPKRSETSKLPRIIRERDTDYQFRRLILFQRLLRVFILNLKMIQLIIFKKYIYFFIFSKGYPFTSPILKKEAAIDIPPLVRGEVWAALLGIKGDTEEQYMRIDKETPTPTDRQVI